MLITIIHGTFFWTRPTWTKSDSQFSRTLQEKLNPVSVKPWNWSGGNTHLARIRAARKLKAYLSAIAAQNPHEEHVVIAHSHGGTVLLYALRMLGALPVGRIVLLATPIIRCRARNVGLAGLFPIAISWLFLPEFVMLCLCSGYKQEDMLWNWAPSTWALVIAMIWALFWISAYFIFEDKVLPKVGAESFPKLYQQIKESFHFPSLQPGKLRIVRAPGDEASLALSFFQALASIFGLTGRLINSLNTASMWAYSFREERWSLPSILTGFVLLFSGIIVAICNFYRSQNPFDWPLSAALSSIALIGLGSGLVVPSGFFKQFDLVITMPGFVLTIITGAILALPVLLICFLTCPFGWDIGILGSLFEFTVEMSLPNESTVFGIEGEGSGTLWHSSPWESPEGVDQIVGWLRSQ